MSAFSSAGRRTSQWRGPPLQLGRGFELTGGRLALADAANAIRRHPPSKRPGVCLP